MLAPTKRVRNKPLHLNIVTTRFDAVTWERNEKYRKYYGVRGCLYSDQLRMPSKVSLDAVVCVVEMNNSLNRIEGAGLVRNRPVLDTKVRMYTERNYNRFVYRGKHRISRETMERLNPDLVKTLDAVLFKGKTHMKRGAGYTRMTEKVMANERCAHINISDELADIFKKNRAQRNCMI